MDIEIRSHFSSPPRLGETVRPGTANAGGAVLGVSSGAALPGSPISVEHQLNGTKSATSDYFVVTATVYVYSVQGRVARGRFHVSMTYTARPRREPRHIQALNREPSAWVLIASALLLFGLNVRAQNNGWVLVPPSQVPKTATFWIMSWTENPPVPFNPYPGCDVYWMGNDQFVVDDSAIVVANAFLQAESMGMAEDGELPLPEDGGEAGAGTNDWSGTFENSSLVVGPNDLWLQVTGVTNANVFITANNTHSDAYYQLLSKTNFNQLDWSIEQEFLGTTSSTQTVLNPVPMQDRPRTFFWAAHSDQLVSIVPRDPSYETAPGFPGWFVFVSSEIPASDLVVHYRISGTASNGLDYESLNGSATIPAGVGSTNIYIHPIADSLAEGAETVTLTLIAGTDYLLLPGYTTATIPIYDSTISVSVSNSFVEAIEPGGPAGAPDRKTSFTVIRTDDFYQFPPMTVNYVLSGTASNGVDYASLSGTIEFLQGVESAQIDVTSLADSLVEGRETLSLTLVPTTNFIVDLTNNAATVGIKDSSTTVTVSGGGQGIEPGGPPGKSGLSCSFELDRTDERWLFPAITVHYTLSGTASNGTDYASLSGAVTFPADSNSVSVVVQPSQDFLVEGVETVVLTLTNIDDSYVIGQDAASATNAIADSSTMVRISATSDSVEINQAGSLASQDGLFTISRTDSRLFVPQYPAMTVYYRVSGGTAIGGVDYATTNLIGRASFLAGQDTTTIFVRGLEDNIIEPPETVTISLIATNGYMVDINWSNATLSVQDNVATNIFVPVVTNLLLPIGIDYHAPSNSLIVSRNFDIPDAPDLARVYVQGGTIVTQQWSTIHGLPDELKLATVKVTTNGFISGQTYFGTGTNRIGRISVDGATAVTNWTALVGETQDLRGSLYVDQTGVWSNDLIAVMSDDVTNNFPKHIYRVHANGTYQGVAFIGTPHLEGCITVPNDYAKWGAWAGCILTGDETTHVIYAITTNGAVSPYFLAINPEDFDFIHLDEHLYMCDPDRNMILKLTAIFDSSYAGALLITQAGESHEGAKLFIVTRDVETDQFVIRSIAYRLGVADSHFEHVTFAPIDLPAQ